MPEGVSTPRFVLRARVSQLIELRRWDEALSAALDALAIDAEDPWLLCCASLCCAMVRRHIDGLAYADAAVGVNPDNEWAHRLRSIALGGIGRQRESATAAKEAIRLAPEGVDGYLCLSNAYRRSSERTRHYRAVAPAHEATRLAPSSAGAWWTLAAAYERMRQWALAEPAYREAIHCDPESVAALTGLARVITHRGAVQEMTELYAAALALDPMCDEAEKALRHLARTSHGRLVRRILQRRFGAPGVASLLMRRQWWKGDARAMILHDVNAVVALAALLAWPVLLLGLITRSHGSATPWWPLLVGDSGVVIFTMAMVERGRTFSLRRALWIALGVLVAGAVLATQTALADQAILGGVSVSLGLWTGLLRRRKHPGLAVGTSLRGGPIVAIWVGTLLIGAALVIAAGPSARLTPPPSPTFDFTPTSFPPLTFPPCATLPASLSPEGPCVPR